MTMDKLNSLKAECGRKANEAETEYNLLDDNGLEHFGSKERQKRIWAEQESFFRSLDEALGELLRLKKAFDEGLVGKKDEDDKID